MLINEEPAQSPLAQLELLELWSTSTDSPHPTSTHRAEIWENYLTLSILSKNMSGYLIPECLAPLQETHPSSPNFILEGACPTSSVKMNIISCGAVSLHCLFSTYTIWPVYRQKHTGHSLLSDKLPRRRDCPPFASDLSFSIPKYQGQKTLNIYICHTQLLTRYKNCSHFPLGHAQLPTIIHIP